MNKNKQMNYIYEQTKIRGETHGEEQRRKKKKTGFGLDIFPDTRNERQNFRSLHV